MQSLGDHPHQSPAQRANSQAKLYNGGRYDSDRALRLNENNGTRSIVPILIVLVQIKLCIPRKVWRVYLVVLL
jgi:hypothetical protein